MDAVDGGQTRDDRFPIVFFLVERLPQSALLHLEFGEFAAMVDLNGFVGISVKCLLKGPVRGLPRNPDGPPDRGKRNPAQPERNNLLLAPRNIDLRLFAAMVAATRICRLSHTSVENMLSGGRGLPQAGSESSAPYVPPACSSIRVGTQALPCELGQRNLRGCLAKNR